MGSVVFFMSRVDCLVACGSWCVSTKWQSDGRRWTSHIESPDPEVSEISPDALLHGNTDGDEFVGMLLSFLNYLLSAHEHVTVYLQRRGRCTVAHVEGDPPEALYARQGRFCRPETSHAREGPVRARSGYGLP